MEMEIRLGPEDRVEARFEGLALVTDQDGSQPAPFDLFLASIGTCAGIYVSRFCRKRGISTEGIRVVQSATVDPATRMVTRIDLDIQLPSGFPDSYRDAVVRSAGLCAVKKHLENPPEIDVHTSTLASV